MQEHPITFSLEKLQSVLLDVKTQHRFVIDPQPPFGELPDLKDCPYHPGDVFWIQREWVTRERKWETYEPENIPVGTEILYKDDLSGPVVCIYHKNWRPAHTLPRWASRYSLHINRVYYQRLLEITQEEGISEGCNGGCLNCGEEDKFTPGTFIACSCGDPQPDHRDAYLYEWICENPNKSLWDNPWLWVIEFELYIIDGVNMLVD